VALDFIVQRRRGSGISLLLGLWLFEIGNINANDIPVAGSHFCFSI
jgi:hypothetical protein